MQQAPLIVHAIHHLVTGGLENGLINLINSTPVDRYRHAIVCLADYSEFRDRITRNDVEVYAMHCKPGRDPAVAWRLWKLFREIRPSILHSRNLSGLDALLPAALAGVRCRIHGEHGWYDDDPDGSNVKYRLLRKLHRPLINRYIALSADLERYLTERIGVPANRISHIYNGVDTDRFHPGNRDRSICHTHFSSSDPDAIYVGWAGRFQIVKDPLNLAQAFAHLVSEFPDLGKRVRLVLIGDGSERQAVNDFLVEAGIDSQCWLPGNRNDVPDLLRALDIFVLPSRAEGISNTILESMASGLPTVATRVGGNEELVIDGQTGMLVPHSDPRAMAAALADYVGNPELRRLHGNAGRQRAVDLFSLRAMTRNYLALYDEELGRRSGGGGLQAKLCLKTSNSPSSGPAWPFPVWYFREYC